ncbi:MAG: class I SAM-dependent methyltransferase [Pseudomonadota bacterium]
MREQTHTWHHGLVSRWWAEFNQGGADIEQFRRLFATSGEPILDAGCGTGRLLLPYLEAGMQIHGTDASTDMLDWCAQAARSRGLEATLYPQAMHQLDIPHRYRTIIVCGAFGLGGSRAQDLEGLIRIHKHLHADGLLVIDHHLPNFGSKTIWQGWLEAPELPRSWPEQGDKRRTADGDELELKVRQTGFDPLEQTTEMEIQIRHLQGERTLARESYSIAINLYFKPEIELLLRLAGFSQVEVTTLDAMRAPQPWQDERIVFLARP